MKNGLPIGVQLTAAKGREDILLQVAETLEVLKVLGNVREYIFRFNYLQKPFLNVNHKSW